MKIFGLKRKSIPKIAVLATGLAVAMMAATINPPPAQAWPTEQTGCTSCHGAGGSVSATPSSATVAPSASYTVALAYTGGTVGGRVGYAITGNGASVTGSNGGPVSMTAPASAGDYTYTVWMRTGVVATTTYTIRVEAAPVVVTTTTALAMSPTDATAVAPAAKTLDATVTGAGAAGTVEFFNGIASLGSSPVAAGSATLALSAIPIGSYSYHAVFTPTDAALFTSSNSGNLAFTVTAPDPVVVAPVAGFTAAPTSGTAALTVAMTDTSTNTPTSWLWDFGNGTTSTVQNPSVTYATAGPYSVTLTATNSAGSSTSAAQTITVTAAPVAVPVSSFTSSVAGGVAPLTVAMTDTSTGTPTSWAWNFGNGTTSTLESPSVTYAAAGSYTVTLTASNAGGAGNTVSKVITVTAAPVAVPTASFDASAITGFAPLTVDMTDTSTGTPTSWAWDFQNGVSTVQNPSVTFNLIGTYTVTLIATNASGASTPVTKTITVTAPLPVVVAPVISTLLPANGAIGDTVTITGTGFGTAGVVTFDGLPVATTSWTDTAITFVAPDGIRRNKVTVTPSNGASADVASNSAIFKYIRIPRVR